MNNLLELKGEFNYAPNNTTFGNKNLPTGKSVSATKLLHLADDLQAVLQFWEKETLFDGALVSVYYNRLVPKSRRINTLLKDGSILPNQSVRGAKFGLKGSKNRHIFTHFVSLHSLRNTIKHLQISAKIINENYNGMLTYENIEKLTSTSYTSKALARTTFVGTAVDAFHVDSFGIEQTRQEFNQDIIVTLYQTNKNSEEILRKIGMNTNLVSKYDDSTFLLKAEQINLLTSKAPYLIAMQTVDLSELSIGDVDIQASAEYHIPSPTDEPVIGVIDTIFSEHVPFNEWVEYHCRVSPDIPVTAQDTLHGTAVSSIIVDGPNLNRALDDGCGRFRVRHFGVCGKGKFSAFSIMKEIKNIVSNNLDIKVWNLSLGSSMETSLNFISPEGAILDELQAKYDVIFIVAGTNKPQTCTMEKMRIGAPADSLNSLVVNSVDFNGTPAPYTRTGPVLSFFNKPDVSYYGGTIANPICVCTPSFDNNRQGTSFAAPWIARKMAYLIYKVGLSREVAKALLIDSAAKWTNASSVSPEKGYGVVPIHIKDILQTGDDEIKFIMQTDSDEYETYTYNIPVPYVDGKYPFLAKATLCYFPHCSRVQGVDYTNTEVVLKIGRVNEDGKISPINKDKQDGEDSTKGVLEEDARLMYRKWDNVKHICEPQKSTFIPRKAYGEKPLWGLSVKTKERLYTTRKERIRFAVVVTLKEMKGINRHSDFVKRCHARGWLVKELNVENRLRIHATAEQQLEFDLDS